MKRTRHATPLLLACLLSIGAAGCSDDVEPRFEPAPTPSVSATPSTTPSAEPTPVALGPEETVRAWVKARNGAMRTGDVEAVRALSSQSCSSCVDLIEPIATTYSKGGRYETAGWQIIRSKAKGGDTANASVTAAMRLAGGTTYDSATSAPVTYPAEKRIAVFELVREEGAWLVSLLGFLR